MHVLCKIYIYNARFSLAKIIQDIVMLCVQPVLSRKRLPRESEEGITSEEIFLSDN